MLTRWIRRACWIIVFIALVLVPTRLAHGPAQAGAAEAPAPRAPFAQLSPVTWVTVGGLTLGFTLFALLRRPRHN